MLEFARSMLEFAREILPGVCGVKCYCGEPAAYIWTAQPSGNELPLCEECCALWRADAVLMPWLVPLRIRSLD